MYENPRIESVGKRIQQLLSSLNKTQTQVCKEIGISKTAMSNYINDNRTPDTITCLKLSKALGTTMEWLLTGEDEPNKEPQGDEINSSTQSKQEEPVESLSVDERLLLDNYRDMPKQMKLELQKKAAYMIAKDERSKLLTSANIKDDDTEIAKELGIG